MPLQEIEHDLEAGSGIVVERQRMTGIRLDSDFDISGVRVGLCQSRHISQPLGITAADVKVESGKRNCTGALKEGP